MRGRTRTRFPASNSSRRPKELTIPAPQPPSTRLTIDGSPNMTRFASTPKKAATRHSVRRSRRRIQSLRSNNRAFYTEYNGSRRTSTPDQAAPMESTSALLRQDRDSSCRDTKNRGRGKVDRSVRRKDLCARRRAPSQGQLFFFLSYGQV